jgi:hypothetical protein
MATRFLLYACAVDSPAVIPCPSGTLYGRAGMDAHGAIWKGII